LFAATRLFASIVRNAPAEAGTGVMTGLFWKATLRCGFPVNGYTFTSLQKRRRQLSFRDVDLFLYGGMEQRRINVGFSF
jgi:hypothetical protein